MNFNRAKSGKNSAGRAGRDARDGIAERSRQADFLAEGYRLSFSRGGLERGNQRSPSRKFVFLSESACLGRVSEASIRRRKIARVQAHRSLRRRRNGRVQLIRLRFKLPAFSVLGSPFSAKPKIASYGNARLSFETSLGGYHRRRETS